MINIIIASIHNLTLFTPRWLKQLHQWCWISSGQGLKLAPPVDGEPADWPAAEPPKAQQRRPQYLTTFEAWRARHPDTPIKSVQKRYAFGIVRTPSYRAAPGTAPK